MIRSRSLFCALCPLFGLALALLYLFGVPSLALAQNNKAVSFIKDVAPILKENCFGCHDAKKKKGKFDMTTYEKFRTGGRNDDPVVPGNPRSSYIMDVLTATDLSMMPPKDAGGPLAKDKVEIIAAWIKQGAKLDSGITPKADLLRELRIRWQPPEPPVAYKFPSNINAVVFTPDSKKLVTGGYHELLVWDIKSGKLKKRIHTRAERAYDLHFLPDGKLAVAGGRPGQEGDVRIYDLNGKSKMVDGIAFMDGVSDKSVFLAELVQTNDSMLSLDVSDDGKKLVAAGCDRLVRVWDLGKGVGNAKLEHKIENHADWVLSVNFSPNGRYLLTASRDKSAKVWDLQKKESLVTFQGHANIVYGAVMSTNHKLGISAGEDRNLRSWNTEVKSKKLGKQVRSGGGHAKPIFKLVEYRQGNNHLLATCSADGTVRLWDDNLRSKRTLSGFEDWVYALAISPNGELVAAGGWDGEIRVWQVKDGKLVQEFNASPGFVATSGK